MKSAVEQIKNIIRPSELISAKVALKQKGSHFLGLCPFHNEKTPSFTVSDEKGFYHCFGCGAHGDIFSYVMSTQSLSYFEAINDLANLAGIALPDKKHVNIEQERQIENYYHIYEAATSYFQKKLKNVDGKEAMQYLETRSITEDLIEKFRIGFAPSTHDELLVILNKNFTKSDIIASKILQLNDRFEYYNLLRNRIIFPIFNIKGRVISFGGRIINKGEPKYINSTENPIFHKGHELYGLNFAKENIKNGPLMLAEGYLDVISMHKHGYQTVVAPLGTAVKDQQIALLWKYCNEPLICMDDDLAGTNASVKIAHNALPHITSEKSLRFIKLKGGKDPDEIIKKHGYGYFANLISSAVSLSDYLFEHVQSLGSYNTPEQILNFKNKLLEICDKIEIKELKKSYEYYLTGKYYELFKYNKVQAGKKGSKKAKYAASEINLFLEADNKDIICAIIYLLLDKDKLLEHVEIIDNLSKLEIQEYKLNELRNLLIDSVTNKNHNANWLDDLRVDFSSLNKYNPIHVAAYNYENIDNVDFTRSYINRLFEIISLKSICEQLDHLVERLNTYPSEELFQKLINLKKYEEDLKTKLGII